MHSWSSCDYYLRVVLAVSNDHPPFQKASIECWEAIINPAIQFLVTFLVRVINSNHIDKDNRHTASHHLHLRRVMPNWSHFTGSNWSSHGISWLQRSSAVMEQWLWLDTTREIPCTGQGVCLSQCTGPLGIIIVLIWEISKASADCSCSTCNMK